MPTRYQHVRSTQEGCLAAPEPAARRCHYDSESDEGRRNALCDVEYDVVPSGMSDRVGGMLRRVEDMRRSSGGRLTG
jgi:hypothetical protein